MTGRLHVFVAFDWGEEVDLDAARRLVPAEVEALARRKRTPSSIAYRPAPLRYLMGHVPLQLPEIGSLLAEVEATLFDFGAVSTAFKVPCALRPDQLTRLAAWLSESGPLVQTARSVLTPLYQQLKPTIVKPEWREELNEEYLVFELAPRAELTPDAIIADRAPWLAGLLTLDPGPLSDEEIADAMRLRISYSPSDLLLSDWAAAVLIDDDCEETLQVIELSNLQLLEYRYLDNRLDDILTVAHRQIQRTTRSWRPPLLRLFHRPLRELSELRFDANEVFERTGNVLKLVGDQYLARAYRQLAERFHLRVWEQSIHRKFEVLEEIFKTLSEQAATARAELLEVTIVLLIVFEIAMTLMGIH